MTDQQFKYKREDFHPLGVTLNHLTLYVDFRDEQVQVSNLLDITAAGPLNQVELDARDLKILSVEGASGFPGTGLSFRPLSYRYAQSECKLMVDLPKPVDGGERFLVRTVTQCIPSDHILEGIYKDSTPEGAPQQHMSQCQQWGFQRIAPILDDCRAKCTMTTTIEADAAYTHMISNGNISRLHNPEGLPVPKPGAPFRKVITYENSIPMAPYLFLVCVGTWDMLVDSVTYPSGRTVRLEYLVPKGRTQDAAVPMAILKEAVLWVDKTQNYEYTADTYRTICMNKSNFGGMENMGNTTIVTDAALIDEHTLDHSLLYAHGVIVHEFEHNQCGSETTMETPFDVWLNEAFTVDVERRFMADLFDPAFVRLAQVDSIRSPLLGPLAVEDSGRAGRIVREGFNDPDELIDGVTYVKAAEVIRMLRLIIGTDKFAAGKDLYFSRYKHSNANTEQFFECFEQVSGRSLDLFKTGWLYLTGYPKVTARAQYDAEQKEYRIEFSQECDSSPQAFHLPIDLALVDLDGQVVPGSEQIFELTDQRCGVTIKNVPEAPAFASMNRDCSFYGTFVQEDVTLETLARQARLDTNAFNRVEAMRRLTDRERIALLVEPGRDVDPNWLTIYGEIIEDKNRPAALKAYSMRIDEQPLDRQYATWYRELVSARERLMSAVNETYRDTLLGMFESLDTYRARRSPKDGIEDRMLKNVLLDLIAIEDSPESHHLILNHYRHATTASDKVAALVALNRCSSPKRHEVLEEVYETWHSHLSAYANYLRVVSSGTRDDVFDMMETEKNRPTFDITHPTWSRALFLPMAVNNKMLWTDHGIRWLADTVISLSRINAYVASRLLNAFQMARKLKPDLQPQVVAALEQIKREVPDSVSPTIHGQAGAYSG